MSDINFENVEKLISMMVDNDLTELQYELGDFKIELKRGGQPMVTTAQQSLTLPSQAPALEPTEGKTASDRQDEYAGLVPIKSPMVGTYYSAADPESQPFVQAGTAITPDSVVCIIEAMKVFNEIKAEVAGTIEKIVASNASAVEYGQPLFYVRPLSS